MLILAQLTAAVGPRIHCKHERGHVSRMSALAVLTFASGYIDVPTNQWRSQIRLCMVYRYLIPCVCNSVQVHHIPCGQSLAMKLFSKCPYTLDTCGTSLHTYSTWNTTAGIIQPALNPHTQRLGSPVFPPPTKPSWEPRTQSRALSTCRGAIWSVTASIQTEANDFGWFLPMVNGEEKEHKELILWISWKIRFLSTSEKV